MKTITRMALASIPLPFLLTACLSNNTTMQQGSVMVSEVVSICGAMVGGQAEERINQEWAKYPEAEASRSTIEGIADVLLTNPDATEEQRNSQYSKYITCATGLMTVNQFTK